MKESPGLTFQNGLGGLYFEGQYVPAGSDLLFQLNRGLIQRAFEIECYLSLLKAPDSIGQNLTCQVPQLGAILLQPAKIVMKMGLSRSQRRNGRFGFVQFVLI